MAYSVAASEFVTAFSIFPTISSYVSTTLLIRLLENLLYSSFILENIGTCPSGSTYINGLPFT
ncbi:hypothetical protein D3C71_2197150 [compost metagenome]